MAVDDVWCPLEFLYCLEYSAGIEDGSFAVVFVFFAFFVGYDASLVEVVIVVDEVYLHACRGQRCYLDDEWVVGVIDDEVHA